LSSADRVQPAVDAYASFLNGLAYPVQVMCAHCRVTWLPMPGASRLPINARSALNNGELAAAWAEGQAMSAQQAIAYSAT